MVVQNSSLERHDIPEIRSRALRHIDGKLKRSIDLNEDLIFSPGNLIKHLIRWFGQKPISEEENVLKIILLILQSKYGNEAVHYLTKDRLIKEFNKIDKLIQNQHSKALLFEIIDHLNELPSSNGNCSLNRSDQNEHSVSVVSSISDILLNDTSEYELAWSVPPAPDLNSLKLLSESLAAENEDDLYHAFNYMDAAINDYPAEYFLQPPYIFNSLLLLTKKHIFQTDVLLKLLTSLTKSLSGRIKKRQLAIGYTPRNENDQHGETNNQITPQRFCIVLFNLCIEFYKQASEEPNKPPPSQVYLLQNEILEVIASDLQFYDFRNTILVDLGNLTRYYRRLCSTVDPSNSLNRALYIYMLDLIVKVLNIESRKNIQLVPTTASKKFNYNPEIYMSTSSSTNTEYDNKEIWMAELECAVFDFPLKEIYPDLYKNINLFAQVSEKKSLQILLNCEESIGKAIKIFKQYNGMDKENFLMESSQLLNTIFLTKNTDVVENLLDAIVECVPRLSGNRKLRDCVELSLLKLLSHSNSQIQKAAYKICNDKVKSHFAEVMNGEVTLNEMLLDADDHVFNFGIPLTLKILNELIYHGCASENKMIKVNAETILILLLKARPILDDVWNHILDNLLPSIPLLQAAKSASLSELLLKLFDPEERFSGLSLVEQLKGNLRFLFSKDDKLRTNALSRIIYMITTQNDSSKWIPNVLEISDTILNNICIIDPPRHADKMFTSGLYERSTVVALLKVLQSNDVEPAIRKTTLLQLNVMCQDPDLAEFIHDENGWSLALIALDNALKKNGCIDYPDAAIPAIGIICKITLCHPEFRRELSEHSDVYFLLLRALFAFPYEDIFKQDCILLLFLLSFNNILIGRIHISTPEICRGLKMPMMCKFNVQKSDSFEKNSLEQAYYELFSCVSSSPRSDHSTDFHLDVSRFNDNVTIMRECVLRYLRLQFAVSWYGGLENILNKPLNGCTNKNSSISSILSGRRHSGHKNDDMLLLKKFLKFSPELVLETKDIEKIKTTSANENIKQVLYDVANASSHEQVVTSIHKIQLCVMISKTISVDQQNNILNTFKRYLMTSPNNRKDITLFNHIIYLLINLIESGNNYTLILILKELNLKYCLFLNLLANLNGCTQIYKLNCKFLQTIVKNCIYQANQPDIQSHLIPEKRKDKLNLYNLIFESARKAAEETFQKRDIDRFRPLLNLIQFLSASRSLDLDEGFSLEIISKMIDFMIKLKSFTQTGSHLNKNGLLIIRNIIEDIKEVVLEIKSLKCLASLGGHRDFEIRAMSWSIFEKISRSLKGSNSMIKALSYLPDGFHGYCISTLLNVKEAPLVRATAGGVLANLLTHRKETPEGKRLNISAGPLSCNLQSTTLEDTLRSLEILLNKHRFYDRIDVTLDHFYLSDVILVNGTENLTTCGIIKIYCSILANLIEIFPDLLGKYFEYPFFHKIFRLINSIPLSISESSMDMLSNICQLLAKFLQFDENLIMNLNPQDKSFIKVLLDILDWKLYEDSSNKHPIPIITLLTIIGKDTVSYSTIMNNLEKDSENRFFNFIFHALLSKNISLQRSTIDFLRILFVKSQTDMYGFRNFFEIIESTEFTQLPNITANNQYIKQNSSKFKMKYTCDILVVVLSMVFTSFECNLHTKHSCERQKLLTSCSETLAVLLKCSRQCRLMANKIGFLEYLLNKLGKIFDDMGMSCTDFIRKYGDTKKLSIIEEFIFIFEIISNWYYEDSIEDENHINLLAKMCLQTWPWINHSTELRTNFVKMLAFLTEISIAVCKQFSSTVSGQSSTILQQLISLLVQETMKAKTSQIDTSLLEVGLRALSNCCSCIEGRMQCIKFNVLDIFNKFHPSVTKYQKCWNPIIALWLNFWEIFSRYTEGAAVKHMHLLGMLSAKSTAEIRYKCLAILRNMTFVNSNRAALCSSEDFLYIVKATLSDGSRAEQLLVLVAIWKLIAGNCKAKHAIKSTSIPKKIKIIQNEILTSYAETNNDDFLNVIEILVQILT